MLSKLVSCMMEVNFSCFFNSLEQAKAAAKWPNLNQFKVVGRREVNVTHLMSSRDIISLEIAAFSVTFSECEHSTYLFFPSAHLPMWKNLLTHHQQWDGRYTYRHANSSLYDCSLRVMSLGQKENSESYLILTADHIDIDMKSECM